MSSSSRHISPPLVEIPELRLTTEVADLNTFEDYFSNSQCEGGEHAALQVSPVSLREGGVTLSSFSEGTVLYRASLLERHMLMLSVGEVGPKPGRTCSFR